MKISLSKYLEIGKLRIFIVCLVEEALLLLRDDENSSTSSKSEQTRARNLLMHYLIQ